MDKVARKLAYWGTNLLAQLCFAMVGISDDRRHPPADVHVISPRQTVRCDFPKYRYHGRAPKWMTLRDVWLDPVFTLAIADAEIIRGGIVIRPDNTIVLESTIFQREYLDKLHANRELLLRPLLPAQQLGRVISLSNYLETNYFHWMMEGVARLAAVDDDVRGDRQVLVRGGAPRFVHESLRFLFDLPDERIVEQTQTRARAAECLVIAFPHTRNERTQWTNVYRPEVIRRINALAMSKLGPIARPRRNLIISRAGSVGRQILNEQAIRERFPSLDFQIVRPETMSLAEQVRLFAEAGTIIATHGAGLTNMLFARDALVIEFFPATRNIRDAFYFAQISAALGLSHTVIEYQPVNPSQDLHLTHAHLDQVQTILAHHDLLGQTITARAI